MLRPPLRDRVQGRWPAVLALLGMKRECLTGKHIPCPFCGGKDRFRFINKDGSGNWVCNSCGRGDGVQLAERLLGLGFKDAAARIEEVLGEAKQEPVRKRDVDAEKRAKRAAWSSANPIQEGDQAWVYLTSRGLVVPTTTALRYGRSVPYDDYGEDRRFCAAMLALVLGPDDRPVNIHRTFLTPDGRKGGFGKDRKMMPGEIPPGSAIRLFEAGPVLGIAEGIETALAAAKLFGIPVWAGVSAWGVETFREPTGLTELVVFGDSDASYAGQAAAYLLAKKAVSRKVPSVRVELPQRGDWNDALRAAE